MSKSAPAKSRTVAEASETRRCSMSSTPSVAAMLSRTLAVCCASGMITLTSAVLSSWNRLS
ncbi:hypothetical protein [Bifidobacterium magnum]|uniref:hypothetical protein n=1 Tax=Bifidobacterium magnum TaxID=1692 RepID=UPI000684E0F9|nr:hypothetical protein [Bifidobacterium magnum]